MKFVLNFHTCPVSSLIVETDIAEKLRYDRVSPYTYPLGYVKVLKDFHYFGWSRILYLSIVRKMSLFPCYTAQSKSGVRYREIIMIFLSLLMTREPALSFTQTLL